MHTKRKQRFIYNTISSIVNQVTTVICGFILPGIIIGHYGSSVNGLIHSMVSFIGMIGIFDAGMGVVIESCLYEPIANDDFTSVSKIMTSGKRFYYKLVAGLFIYIALLAIVFPYIAKDFEPLFTIMLLLAISVSSFGEYALGITNAVLLSADQRKYINLLALTATTLINTITSVILIHLGYSIQVVKLISSLVFVARPVFLALFVKKNYSIIWHASYSCEPIKQKWNGFAQHLAFLITSNTDIAVLTLFSSLESVSVYSVYYMVINGVKMIISACMAGFDALLGNLFAKKETKEAASVFGIYETFDHFLVTTLFGMTAVLIVPFVEVYTRRVVDVDYFAPAFGKVICLAYALYCIRIPYYSMIKVAGRFKQTQGASFIEAVLNIVISVVAVIRLGLVGVAMGTAVAMGFRTIYLVYYVSFKVFDRKMKIFIKHIVADGSIIALMMVSTSFIKLDNLIYYALLIMAIKG